MAGKASMQPQTAIDRKILDFYGQPGPMTSAGAHAKALRDLPDDIPSLVGIVQGLAIHHFVAEPMYGLKIPKERLGESHLRHADRMLDRIFELDPAPLTKARPPEKRLVGVCHHFMRLLLTMLRVKGIPARARTGFGAYFNPGFFEDHIVVECWSDPQSRWTRIDAQFDEPWRKGTKIKHDIFDVPRDQFLDAADAWTLCRSGKADAAKFGAIQGNLRGLWFIAASLIREIAELNKMELLQWDIWGGMPKPGHKLTKEELSYFDHLASLTGAADKSFEELRAVYARDDRIRVPDMVFNAVTQHPEEVAS